MKDIKKEKNKKKLKYESDMMTERDYYNIIDTAIVLFSGYSGTISRQAAVCRLRRIL